MAHKKGRKGSRKGKKRVARRKKNGGSVVSTAGTEKTPLIGYFDKYTLKNPTYGIFDTRKNPFEKKLYTSNQLREMSEIIGSGGTRKEYTDYLMQRESK